MKKYLSDILLVLVLIVTVSLSVYDAYGADRSTYWDEELQREIDKEEIIQSIRTFGLDKMARLIYKVGDIDEFIFINGNIEFHDIWNTDLCFLLYPGYYSEYREETGNSYLQYEIEWASTSIESLNECMDSLNLFIYSLGKSGYYKYNYLWKDLNVEIDKINKKIVKYNSKYDTNCSTIRKVEGLYSTWNEYEKDNQLKKSWKGIEDEFQHYYDNPIYPQTIEISE